jgi:hypothetical protein
MFLKRTDRFCVCVCDVCLSVCRYARVGVSTPHNLHTECGCVCDMHTKTQAQDWKLLEALATAKTAHASLERDVSLKQDEDAECSKDVVGQSCYMMQTLAQSVAALQQERDGLLAQLGGVRLVHKGELLALETSLLNAREASRLQHKEVILHIHRYWFFYISIRCDMCTRTCTYVCMYACMCRHADAHKTRKSTQESTPLAHT